MITRGNNRQEIFHDRHDYLKFISLLEVQKSRLPFFLYAYCLMPNHVHLLIERQADNIGRIMHRVLTGFSQYYNRKYRKVGHLLQGRHKAVLCQSDEYLAELVRYIHLNPVRAKMVRRPADYAYSSHRCYLGLSEVGIVDVDPVLRHFGAKRQLAREQYRQFVRAGMKLGHREDLYRADGGRILGSEEFVDATIHQIGETSSRAKLRQRRAEAKPLNPERLISAAEKSSGLRRAEFCGSGKRAAAVLAKEALILVGSRAGASLKALSEIAGIDDSVVSRRRDRAGRRMRDDLEMQRLVRSIEQHYRHD